MKRKGARRISEIPPEVLQALNHGAYSTVNLVEGLAVNQAELLQHLLPSSYHAPLLQALAASPHHSAIASIRVIGKTLAECTYLAGHKQEGDALVALFFERDLDIPLAWGAIMQGERKLALAELLKAIRPFAAHTHFQVREVAWMAVRAALIAAPQEAFELLTAWSLAEDENIRRFSSEATRPKGVWCKQFLAVQQTPELALPLLENLKADPSRYVQNSVGNWLNDLSKVKPNWVRTCCRKWQMEQDEHPATSYIIRRALRSLRSKP